MLTEIAQQQLVRTAPTVDASSKSRECGAHHRCNVFQLRHSVELGGNVEDSLTAQAY